MPIKAISAQPGSRAFRPTFHERAALEHAVRIDVSSLPDPEEKNRMGRVIRRNFEGRTKVSVVAIAVCVLSFFLFGSTMIMGAFWLSLAALLVFLFTPTSGYACSQCMQRIHPQARRCPHCQCMIEHRRHAPTADT